MKNGIRLIGGIFVATIVAVLIAFSGVDSNSNVPFATLGFATLGGLTVLTIGALVSLAKSLRLFGLLVAGIGDSD